MDLQGSRAPNKSLVTTLAASVFSELGFPHHHHAIPFPRHPRIPGARLSLRVRRWDNGPVGASETNAPCWAAGGGAAQPRIAECGFCTFWEHGGAGRGPGPRAPIGHGARGRAKLVAAPGPSGRSSRGCGGGGEVAAWSRPGGAGGSSGYAPPPSKRPGAAARAELASQARRGRGQGMP